MSRILAIDYGKKRTGVAVTDVLQIIANGLTTVPTHQLLDFILKYVEKEPVERIIVGHPKQMNNQESENMRNIVPFVNQLRKKIPDIPVEFVDERLPSALYISISKSASSAGLMKITPSPPMPKCLSLNFLTISGFSCGESFSVKPLTYT